MCPQPFRESVRAFAPLHDGATAGAEADVEVAAGGAVAARVPREQGSLAAGRLITRVHRFRDYGVVLPASASIEGIVVRLDARADSTSGSPKLCVQLSWHGGASWTSAKTTSTLSTSERTYLLGGATNTWGRTWSAANLANGALRVRVISLASSTSRDFSLDWVAVKVHYTS